jgi:hypothetical protein
MDSGILLTWIGALLIIGGVIYGAALALQKGRLSEVGRDGKTRTVTSLEPQQGIKPLSLRRHWPALALIVAGGILIIARAAF